MRSPGRDCLFGLLGNEGLRRKMRSRRKPAEEGVPAMQLLVQREAGSRSSGDWVAKVFVDVSIVADTSALVFQVNSCNPARSRLTPASQPTPPSTPGEVDLNVGPTVTDVATFEPSPTNVARTPGPLNDLPSPVLDAGRLSRSSKVFAI